MRCAKRSRCAAPTSARSICCRRPSAARRRRRGGSDGAQADRAEQQESARLPGAGRGARGAAAVSGGRRRAGAGDRDVPRRAPIGRSRSSMLLPHSGFAYQELGQYDKAIATFEEARKIAPNDPVVAGYLIQAQLAAKNYTAGRGAGARGARRPYPTICGWRGSSRRRLRQGGKVDQGLAMLEELLQRRGDGSGGAHRARAGVLRSRIAARRRSRCCRTRRRRFPAETDDHLRARRGAREAEEVRRGRSRRSVR